MQLTCADIHFDRAIKTKDEALQRVVGRLTEAGHTTPAYLNGMREREGQISTYLGNGIAIPHGTPQSRDAVLKTGVKVLACPQGVDWGEEQAAYLIVGIAAQDNEHLDILPLRPAISSRPKGKRWNRPRRSMKRRLLPCAIPTDCTRGQALYW